MEERFLASAFLFDQQVEYHMWTPAAFLEDVAIVNTHGPLPSTLGLVTYTDYECPTAARPSTCPQPWVQLGY